MVFDMSADFCQIKSHDHINGIYFSTSDDSLWKPLVAAGDADVAFSLLGSLEKSDENQVGAGTQDEAQRVKVWMQMAFNVGITMIKNKSNT